MKIHCICVVRDEVDILGHTLDAALEWAHTIYACDNGSNDGTWELLQEYAARHPEIVLVPREHGVFQNSLRGAIANRFRHEPRLGDWWCRLDADEMYIDDPRRFLTRIPAWERVVFSVSFHYYFTDSDLAAYEHRPSLYLERWRPERLRHYLANWSEARFVRHIPGVAWEGAWPEGVYHMGAARKRIRLRHYQYRSPPQIQHRLRLRLRTSAFRHEKRDLWLPAGLRVEDLVWPSPSPSEDELWRTRVVRATALERDDGSGRLRSRPELLPPLWPRPSLVQRLRARVAGVSRMALCRREPWVT